MEMSAYWPLVTLQLTLAHCFAILVGTSQSVAGANKDSSSQQLTLGAFTESETAYFGLHDLQFVVYCSMLQLSLIHI